MISEVQPGKIGLVSKPVWLLRTSEDIGYGPVKWKSFSSGEMSRIPNMMANVLRWVVRREMIFNGV